ncbi:hypothetical protein N9104_02190 [Pseudomonadales bacterium]|nr:hypothetical protein [bacterium]MDB4567552.1 hypothetical protein [Pseudomonadales bacterium]
MKDRFDLEAAIMNCWNVVDDTKLMAEMIVDTDMYKGLDPKHQDQLSNQLTGIGDLYELRFQKLWNTFRQVNKLDDYS